jgi:hypothetical protein
LRTRKPEYVISPHKILATHAKKKKRTFENMMPEYVVSPHKILATHAFFGTLHVRNVEFAVGLDAKRKRKKWKKRHVEVRAEPHCKKHCKKSWQSQPLLT